jgi:hypothetical protein
MKKNEIKVNGALINLKDFLKNTNLKGNFFQLSFYDINHKYIVSKKIMKIQYMNFSLFYGKYINDLTEYSSDLDSLKKEENKFKDNASKFYRKCIIFILKLLMN